MISVYRHLTSNNITDQDEESIARYVRLIQWGRSHPVQFIEHVLGVPLMDYQRWLVSMTWVAEYAVWVCSRNAGKSFLLGNFTTARALLFPNQRIHIMSTGARQANETFETMENIVKRNVPSLKTVNTVFMDEVEKSNANTDGFTHNPKKGNECRLLNGSMICSVVGTEKTVRGKRSTFNAYDEAGTINKPFFEVTEPFMAQSSDFVMTDDRVNRDVLPTGIKNLRLYLGSASDTSSYFYEKYKECFRQMLIGNSDYFVADINCEIPLAPTRNGEPMKALLSREEISRKMRDNEIMANREYYNIFDRFSLEDSVVSRGDIRENTEDGAPQIRWGGPKHKYVMCFDPAARVDNSPVLVGEVFKNDNGIYEGRICTMVNLIQTYADGSHKPMPLNEQVDKLRELLYEYNGREKIPAYENIMYLMDNGTGGNAAYIAQELVKDWQDKKGLRHPGIIDETNDDMVRWGEKFPHAIQERCRLLEPRVYKNQFFEAMKEEVTTGHIKFPPETPKNDILVYEVEDEKGRTIRQEKKLSKEEVSALVQLDLMKEEAVSIVRSKTAQGNITYGLPPEKKNRMHDDRAYVLAMFCWWVKQLQTDETLGEAPSADYSQTYIRGMANMGKRGQDFARPSTDSGWDLFALSGRRNSRSKSPFGGPSPFSRK